MKTNYSLLRLIFLFILFANFSATGQISISNQPADKIIVFVNSKLRITLDYNLKCVATSMEVRRICSFRQIGNILGDTDFN